MTGAQHRPAPRLAELARQYSLSAPALDKLAALVERFAHDPLAPTSIRDPAKIIDRHLADSLVALELAPVRQAQLALDLGSGIGVPGLPLAAVLTDASFVLLESAVRRSTFLSRTVASLGFTNVRVVHERAEAYTAGLARHDLVVVRAVAPLNVTVEYSAPLLRVGGTLVAWAGRRSSEAEAPANSAARELGLGELNAVRVEPFRGAEHRHLYVTSKVKETPPRFPRRPGVARKRPLGVSAGSADSSDRAPR